MWKSSNHQSINEAHTSLLEAEVGNGFWSGNLQGSEYFGLSLNFEDPNEYTLQGLSEEFNVSLNYAQGASHCTHDKGKKCVALVMLAGLLQEDITKRVGTACPEIQGDDVRGCAFICGLMSNLMWHAEVLAKEMKEDYVLDVVVMHDETLNEQILNLIHRLGARTLKLHPSIKRMACHGYLNVSPSRIIENRLTHEVCEHAPFDGKHFNRFHRMMLVESLKLGAASLTEYDVIVHNDVDIFIESTSDLEEEIDYFVKNPKIMMMARIGAASPLNAGHWLMRPTMKALGLWLEDMRGGFTNKYGWGNAGQVVPQISEIYGDHSPKLHPGDWDFTGSQLDQGLLFHVFAVKLHGYYATGGKAMKIVQEKLDYKGDPIKFVDPKFGDRGPGIRHYCGHGKPWDENACSNKLVTCDRKVLLARLMNRLYPIVESHLLSKKSDFMKKFCVSRLKTGFTSCAPFENNRRSDNC
eukprot:jgi/Bigna1/129007/aug1.8_g3715